MNIPRTALRVACAVLLASTSALAVEPEPGASKPAAGAVAEPVEEAAIPIAEVATRAERAVTWLRGLAPEIEARANLDRSEVELERSAGFVWAGMADTQALLQEGPRPAVVESTEAGWTEGRQQLSAQSDALTAFAEQVEKALAEVKASRERWQRTDQLARDTAAPASVLARIEDTEHEIDLAKEQLLALRERILLLQDKAARLVAVSDEVLASLAIHRREAAEAIGTPSSRPLWDATLHGIDPRDAARRLETGIARELSHSQRFLERRAGVFQLQILVFGVLVLLFRAARSRAAQRAERDPALRDALAVVEFPYSAALLLTLISSLWLHPELPNLMVNGVALLSLVPVLRILRRLAHPSLVWLAYTFAGFFVVDRVRDFVAPVPLVEQLVLVAEMSAGLGIMLWILRPGRLREVEIDPARTRGLRPFGWAVRTLAVAFGAALVAALLGYMQLARFVAFNALGAVYTGMVLYAAARAARGLATFLLYVRPFSELRMVQRHRNLLDQRIGRGIVWIATGLWALALVRNVSGFDASGELLRQILDTDTIFGNVTLSVGDILGFAATVWAAFFVSRFVRFVLGEEVYPRLTLAHGVPYALSSLTHYAILLGGFLLAVAGMGLDLDKFTILGGAFGVGIGFGLQTIVNNFVSGLILLFERPVQIGDTVQVGDVNGQVRRIGIRSSTIRTTSGAEVIVPNSSLVSERVTNWTLSDRSRRFEIAVGVAYGTRPAEVIALLADVAKKHPEVLDHPEPMALFVRFGDSSIDFELRAWVVDGDRLPVVKTEVAVALTDALETAGIQIPFPQREVRVLGAEKA